MFRAARNRPHCQRFANGGQFGVTLLLCAFATGCDKTHWHGCARQAGLQVEVAKHIVSCAKGSQAVLDHSATLVPCGIPAGGCKTLGNASRKEELGCKSRKRASWEAAQSRSTPNK